MLVLCYAGHGRAKSGLEEERVSVPVRNKGARSSCESRRVAALLAPCASLRNDFRARSRKRSRNVVIQTNATEISAIMKCVLEHISCIGLE